MDMTLNVDANGIFIQDNVIDLSLLIDEIEETEAIEAVVEELSAADSEALSDGPDLGRVESYCPLQCLYPDIEGFDDADFDFDFERRWAEAEEMGISGNGFVLPMSAEDLAREFGQEPEGE